VHPAQTGPGTTRWVEVTRRIISVAALSRSQESSWSEVVSGKKREKTVVASLHEKELNVVYTYISLYT
jgi:hypothetical protein